jgi:stage V sporulation protein B
MGNKLIKGTLILTISGIITKLIGFYYRIFLSTTIGATGMGIYQMTLPILGLVASLSTAGLELSVSKRVSEVNSKEDIGKRRLISGILYGQIMSLFSCAIFVLAIPILGKYFIKGANINMLLYMLIPAIPLMSLHSALNGYFLGKGKPHIAGISICLENLAKLIFMIIVSIFLADNESLTPTHCVIAISISELASVMYMLIFTYFDKSFSVSEKLSKINNELSTYFHMAIPISITRILLSLMHSIEAILIPSLLISYGLSNDDAIGLYGILVGMSIPFILFPTAISAALSNVLLPSISECISKNNMHKLSSTASTAMKYSMCMGIFFTGFFLIFGKSFGICFFNNALAGEYIRIFAWLCPFIYVDITLSSIINGFGLTKITCRNNIIAALIRTVFLLLFVSHYGVLGFLWGLLAGEIISTLLNLKYTIKLCKLDYNVIDYLIKPILYTFISIGIGLLADSTLQKYPVFKDNFILIAVSAITCIVYVILIILQPNNKEKRTY